MQELFSRYQTMLRGELMEKFAERNMLAAPRVLKIVVNVGLNVNMAKDPKFVETVRSTLQRITGQRPVERTARASVSSFKIRKGQVVGLVVTLRGARMWDFLQKLVTIVFPRTRDFWGLPSSVVDSHGNCSIGLREHLAFPEIRSDEVERIHGLEITIVSNAKNREHAWALYQALGFPLKAEESGSKNQQSRS